MKIAFAHPTTFDPTQAFARARLGETRATETRVPQTTSADPIAVADPATPTTAPRAERGELPTAPRPAYDAAREAGMRARVRPEHDDDHDDDRVEGHERDHENRGAAPGAVRFAQHVMHMVRDELRAFTKGNEELTDDQRDALKQAGKDLRHELRDAASQFTLEDGSFDLAGFFGAVGDSVSSFATRMGGILGVEEQEPVTDPIAEPPVDDSGLADPVAPTRPDAPTPTLDESPLGA